MIKITKIVSKLLLNPAILENYANNQRNGLKTGMRLNVFNANRNWINTNQIHTTKKRWKKIKKWRMLNHSRVDNAMKLSMLRRESIIVTNLMIVNDFITRSATLRISFLNSPSWEVLTLKNKGNGVNTLI
jgi:hypothetical protein